MKNKLLLFRVGLGIYSIIVVALLITSFYSLATGPAMNPETFIQVPEEDEIDWNIEGTNISVNTSVTVSNTGFYDFTNIDLNFALKGLNRTLMDYNQVVDRIPSGETVEIPLNFGVDYGELSDEELETLVFNETTFDVSADLVANYPLSIMKFDLSYSDQMPWEGLIQTLNFDYENAQVEPSGETNIISIPYEIQTSDFLSGDAVALVTARNESKTYSESQETIPLGQSYSDFLEFEINDTETEELLTNSQRLIFDADITFGESTEPFKYQSSYDWGAPFNQFSVDDITYDLTEMEGTGSFSFINDSPRELKLDLHVSIYDSSDNLIGDREISYTENPNYIVPSGETFSESVTVSVDDIPAYAVIEFTETNSGITFEKVVTR